jgi:DNA polymerase-1
VTDRWSSSSPSGQTIPKRGKEATLFRSTIKAPAGYKIVEVDWSQLELRLTAWLNNVPMMLESYAKDIDLHALTAFKNLATQSSNPVSDFIKKNGYNGAFEYFCSLEKSNDNHLKDFYESNRFKAKATNFGLIYKISLNGYLSMAKFQYKRHDLTKEEASKEYQNFFKTYPELITAFNLIEKELLKTKKVKNAFGLYRHLPNIDSKDFSTRNKTFREAVNFVIQSIGGELASIGIVQLHRLKLLNPRLNNLFFMIGFIHDAFVFVVHESVLDTCLSAISHILENLPIKHLFNIECPVPLKVDIKTGDDFNTKTQWSINPYKRFKNLKGVNIPDGDLKSVMEATEPLCEYLW